MARHLSPSPRPGQVIIVVVVMVITATALTIGVRKSEKHFKMRGCLNRTIEIGKALSLYMQDSEGVAPPFSARPRHGAGDANPRNNPKSWREALERYASGDEIFYCPADPHAGQAFQERCYGLADSVHTSYQTDHGASNMIEGGHLMSLHDEQALRLPYVIDRLCQGVSTSDPGKLVNRTFHGFDSSVLYLDGSVKHAWFKEEAEEIR